MTVWVLTSTDCDRTEVEGVFSSLEAAKAAAPPIVTWHSAASGREPGEFSPDWNVEEFWVDEARDIGARGLLLVATEDE